MLDGMGDGCSGTITHRVRRSTTSGRTPLDATLCRWKGAKAVKAVEDAKLQRH